jgi:hypothetical protein
MILDDQIRCKSYLIINNRCHLRSINRNNCHLGEHRIFTIDWRIFLKSFPLFWRGAEESFTFPASSQYNPKTPASQLGL